MPPSNEPHATPLPAPAEAAHDRRSARPAWIFAAIWAGVLFVLSSFPGSAYPSVGFRSADKLVHIALYTPLGAAFLVALTRTKPLKLAAAAAAAIALATGYGVFDELHQWFVPGRSSDWHDVVADLIGGSLGAALYSARKKWSGGAARSRPSDPRANRTP